MTNQLGIWLFSAILGVVILLAFYLSQHPSTSSIVPTQTPYDENTIVSLVNEIYSILIKLNYIPSDFLKYTPPNGHKINTSLCLMFNLEPRVISLMKRLPYPASLDASEYFEIIPQSRPAVYTNDKDLEIGRASRVYAEKSIDLRYLRPHDIVLMHGIGKTGSLVLDTQENTIRTIILHHPSSTPGEVLVTENDAPTVLGGILCNYKTLTWIPRGGQGRRGIFTHGDPGYSKVKNILENGYDWPIAFRQEPWNSQHERIWRESTGT